MQYTQYTVLVTGATGFIGQRVVSHLLQQGHTVRALVRPQKIPEKRLPSTCRQDPVELLDEAGISVIIAECDAVIYCAGSVRGRRPADFRTANVDGIRAVLNALEQTPHAPPLLLISSLAASRPELSDYANSKYAGEQLLLESTQLPWTIIRPPAVYGSDDKEMLALLKMARRGLLVHVGPRDQRLSLIQVDDLAKAVNAWLGAWEQCLHQTYAIDDGRAGGYDWQSIGEAVSAGKYRFLKLPLLLMNIVAKMNLLMSLVLGYAPMLTPGKVRELIQPEWLCDNRQFTAETGWKPTTDLNRGAQQLFFDG